MKRWTGRVARARAKSECMGGAATATGSEGSSRPVCGGVQGHMFSRSDCVGVAAAAAAAGSSRKGNGCSEGSSWPLRELLDRRGGKGARQK